MDLRFAHLMALIANTVRDPKKPAYHPKDFLFDFLTDPDAPPAGQTPAQMQALLEQVTRSVGHRGRIFDADVSDEEMERYVFGGEIPEMDDDEGDEC